MNIFTLPFSRSVWIASVAFIVITGAALYLAFQCEERSDRVTRSDITLLSLGAVCQQGTGLASPRISAHEVCRYVEVCYG